MLLDHWWLTSRPSHVTLPTLEDRSLDSTTGPRPFASATIEADDAVDRRDGNVAVVGARGVGLDEPAIDAAASPAGCRAR